MFVNRCDKRVLSDPLQSLSIPSNGSVFGLSFFAKIGQYGSLIPAGVEVHCEEKTPNARWRRLLRHLAPLLLLRPTALSDRRVATQCQQCRRQRSLYRTPRRRSARRTVGPSTATVRRRRKTTSSAPRRRPPD
uniref:Uncharacterized protein n=1 Tax=Steinernema glaseri TaxID=37863 RepID=A0A1I7YHQ5_9BILA